MQHNAAINYSEPAYVADDGVPVVARTYNIGGILTTDHAASSYGQPVFVAQEGSGFDGRAFGPGEVDSLCLTLDLDHLGDAAVAESLSAAAKRAGYIVK